MKKDMQEHLGQDRILTAFIDRADLSPSEREHLERCAVCENAVLGLAGQLRSVSNKARRHTPGSRVKVTLPETEVKTWSGWYGKWIAAPAAAAACMALIMILFQTGLFKEPLPYGNVSPAAEAAADAQLMEEITDIQEDALSLSQDDAAPAPGQDIDTDEDFLDDLIPFDEGAQS